MPGPEGAGIIIFVKSKINSINSGAVGMKARIVALALAAGPTFAFAQSVTIYGVVDSGMEFLNHVGAGQTSVSRVPTTTGMVPSRWGLRGTEDLGGGLKSIFVLESGFGPDTGGLNQGGRLFGRQALVGLSGKWGQISFGRQNTMLFWANLDADILGPNIYGIASLDSYFPNARADNSVAYKGTFNGLTIGATYSMGRDAVNAGPGPSGTNCAGENASDKSACREWSALLQYEAGWGGVAATYDSIRGGPNAFGGLTRSSLTDNRFFVGGYALLPKSKIGLGYVHRDNEGSSTPKSDLLYVGAAYQVTPAITLAGQVYYLKFKDSPNKALLYALRGTYDFSKRTSAYVTAGFINNDGQSALSVSSGGPGVNTSPGGTQTGAMVGIKHIF